MSKIAGDINAEMMKKAIHDSRAKLFAEIVGKTGSQQSVIDCAMQEIESLRQQLANREAQIVRLRSAIGAWDRAEPDELQAAECGLLKALAATNDLAGVIPCHAEPVFEQWIVDGGDKVKLYRAWEPK